jgi:carbon storage regulator
MLWLTRKARQAVLIGDDILIVVDKRRGQIRVGIEAPQELRIRRHDRQDGSGRNRKAEEA